MFIFAARARWYSRMRAVSLATDGVSEAERSGDQRSLGRALAVRAFVGALRGDDDYRAIIERALAIEAALDEPLGEWSPSVLAAECARHTGDTAAARSLPAEGCTLRPRATGSQASPPAAPPP